MKRTVFSLVALVILVQLITLLPVGVSEAISGEPDILDHRVMSGQTNQLGGGSYLLVRLNDTMTFGVVHGNEKTRAPITVFTTGMDTVAYIKQRNGTFPVRSTTFSIYRLTSLLEFNDTNRNGRFDPIRYADSFTGRDSAVKRLNLSLNWVFSGVRSRESRDGYMWEFSLVARNASYNDDAKPVLSSVEPASISAVSRDSLVELVRFDFRITLSREGRSTVIYTYSIASPSAVSDTDALIEKDRKKIEIEGASVNWKMDHRILGWDFDRNNRNPALMLGFSITYGRAYDSWFSMIADRIISKTDAGSRVTIPVNGATSSIWDESDNRLSALEEGELDEGRISIGAREPVSSLYWLNDLEKTPYTDAGRTGARLFIYDTELMGPGSDIWSSELAGSRTGIGITITGGYTYPPLSLIIHDPGIETLGFRTPVVRGRDAGRTDNIVVEFIKDNTTTTVLFTFLVIFIAIGTAAILTLSKRNGLVHDQELKWEKEEELFTVSRPKKDWDSLRVK